ncbi:hypothetical protein LJR230_001449 [Trinickia sp. LjRoot230]|uniref:hypothetical protein n=1 Tax=Trinickia sp. LjRoot230 TaxID=3342288 RepID=UPI003ED13922
MGNAIRKELSSISRRGFAHSVTRFQLSALRAPSGEPPPEIIFVTGIRESQKRGTARQQLWAREVEIANSGRASSTFTA